jgi:hypothetical protein
MALLGLFFVRRRLYPFMLLWIALCFAKTFDTRPVSDLINLIPMIKLTAFPRYASSSWEFAGAVLAAFTVDGMQRKVDVSLTRMVSMFALICMALICTLWPAHNIIQALMKMRH